MEKHRETRENKRERLREKRKQCMMHGLSQLQKDRKELSAEERERIEPMWRVSDVTHKAMATVNAMQHACE